MRKIIITNLVILSVVSSTLSFAASQNPTTTDQLQSVDNLLNPSTSGNNIYSTNHQNNAINNGGTSTVDNNNSVGAVNCPPGTANCPVGSGPILDSSTGVNNNASINENNSALSGNASINSGAASNSSVHGAETSGTPSATQPAQQK